jgi:hypothetical protein
MAHNTGITDERLGRFAIEAGIAEARVMAGESYDLWAALLIIASAAERRRERNFSGRARSA